MIDKETQRRRQENLGLAIASGRLEGNSPSKEFLYDANQYANGLISSNEFVARMRSRYGVTD
ncbi:antitoxin VbhA family protein [Gardnerella vaginalis]|uniref:antitoxin VbhA family protein n=1 Tax=Gardnerella vaginalis TaxID=2702 RepID=UPI0039F0BDF5